MSRWLPCGGHCCHSGIQVEGFGRGLGDGRERQGKDIGVQGLAQSACWHLTSGLWASCQSSDCSQSWLPHSFRNMNHAFHTTTFASSWGWVQHLCCASTRYQLFLCISAPAEPKTVLKYYPWCSQYFGYSDLGINSVINWCWKIISCCEGRVSRHWGDEAARPGLTASTTLCTALWGFSIHHVAENLLSFVFIRWNCKGVFYPYISKPGTPVILVLWRGLYFGGNFSDHSGQSCMCFPYKAIPLPVLHLVSVNTKPTN